MQSGVVNAKLFLVFRLYKNRVRSERVRIVCYVCNPSGLWQLFEPTVKALVKREELNQFRRFGLEVETFPLGLLCLWRQITRYFNNRKTILPWWECQCWVYNTKNRSSWGNISWTFCPKRYTHIYWLIYWQPCQSNKHNYWQVEPNVAVFKVNET